MFALCSMPPGCYEGRAVGSAGGDRGGAADRGPGAEAGLAKHGLADFTEITQGAVAGAGERAGPSELLLKLDQQIPTSWSTSSRTPPSARGAAGQDHHGCSRRRERTVRRRRSDAVDLPLPGGGGRAFPARAARGAAERAARADFAQTISARRPAGGFIKRPSSARGFPFQTDETSGAVPYSRLRAERSCSARACCELALLPECGGRGRQGRGAAKEARGHGTTALLVRNQYCQSSRS